MDKVIVLDVEGQELTPCSADKAEQLLQAGKATLVRQEPLTIQLGYAVDLPPEPEASPPELPGQGKRLLLHICCAPCATYSIQRLRQVGFELTGHWYNPNIHPFSEHERRRKCLEGYAPAQELPMLWEERYEMPEFLCSIAGRERFGERCVRCYQMRLSQTAARARQEGFDAFTTTLLISPYQNQELIQEVGEAAGKREGVAFFYENLRRGWAERGRLAREAGLYQQRYCGCVYSEWEAQDRRASTHDRGPGEGAEPDSPGPGGA